MSCIKIKEESPTDTEEYQEILTNAAGEDIAIKVEECANNSSLKVSPPENFIEIEVKKESNFVQDVTIHVAGEHVNIKLEKDRAKSLQNVSSTQSPIEVKKEPPFVTDQDVDMSGYVEGIKEEDDITIEPIVLQKRFPAPVYGN